MYYVCFALLAGCCAGLASLLAKFAFSTELISIQDSLCIIISNWIFDCSTFCHKILLLSRIVLFSLTFVFNGLMWTLFVRSMQKLPSAQAMITNSASNFISSALFGRLFFNEVLSLQWWLGASIIVMGLYVINKSKGDDEIVLDDKKDS